MPEPALDPAEYASRLQQIDWYRYRQHWVAITGFKLDRKTDKKKIREIADGKGGKFKIVEGKAENTAATINSVAAKSCRSVGGAGIDRERQVVR